MSGPKRGLNLNSKSWACGVDDTCINLWSHGCSPRTGFRQCVRVFSSLGITLCISIHMSLLLLYHLIGDARCAVCVVCLSTCLELFTPPWYDQDMSIGLVKVLSTPAMLYGLFCWIFCFCDWMISCLKLLRFESFYRFLTFYLLKMKYSVKNDFHLNYHSLGFWAILSLSSPF